MKKVFTYLLLATLIIAIEGLNVGHVSATSINDLEKKINEMEQQQGQLKDEQNNLNSDKQQTDGKIDENVNKQNIVKQDINVIDEKLSITQSSILTKETEITTTNKEIEELSDKIETLKEGIKDLKERIKKRDILLKDRLVAIQKNGGSVKYMEVIFGSQSFGDFISRAFAVNTIIDQDKTILEEHAADKVSLENKQTEVEGKKAEVEEQKMALESQKSELLTLKSQLDNQMNKKSVLMAQLEEEHEELEEYKVSIEEETAALAAQDAAIKKAKQIALSEKSNLEQLALEKAAKEKAEREKAAKAQTKGSPAVSSPPPAISSGNGVFIVPTSGRVSSSFGYRIHPIFGDSRLHAGIDFAAPTGTPVAAAASGVVGTAGVMGGFGNVVMVTHIINGKTYTTLYAHLSSISVSTGQVVNQGDIVGRVGNTGNSTGPHLHFEVHPGGYNNPVNPAGYF